MASRPIDHATRMESSRNRLAISWDLCRNTETIIRETRATIDRTLEKLDPGFDHNDLDERRK